MLVYIDPPLNQLRSRYMLEYFGVTVVLGANIPDLQVEIWTNAVHKFNSDGGWHAVPLSYQQQNESGQSVFTGGFRPTSQGCFEYTYRFRRRGEPWQWAGAFQENGALRVKPPAPEAQWTQGPQWIEILPQVYVGNFIAASQAEQLGIDAVLNLAEELTLSYPTAANIAYKKLGTRDGAQHPIDDGLLQDAIAWIEQQRQRGKKRILVHCRAGIGRSGSVGVAYCFYCHPQWTYEQTLNYAWQKKADIYPHRNLQASLERLFPRR